MRNLVILFVLPVLFTGCGSEKPSATDRAVDLYIGKNIRSVCSVIPEGERGGVQDSSFGLSFVETHQLEFKGGNGKQTSTGAPVQGGIQRTVYHDANCSVPAFTIEIKNISATLQSTDKGFSFKVEPFGSIVAHNAVACQFISKTFDWSSTAEGFDKECQVGKEYSRGDWQYFQRARGGAEAAVLPGKLRLLAYEIEAPSDEASREVNIFGPFSFFRTITQFQGDGLSSPRITRPGYRAINQSL